MAGLTHMLAAGRGDYAAAFAARGGAAALTGRESPAARRAVVRRPPDVVASSRARRHPRAPTSLAGHRRRARRVGAGRSPVVGFLDGRDDLSLGSPFLLHSLDHHPQVIGVHGCRRRSHGRSLRSLMGGGIAYRRAAEPGTREPASRPDRVAGTASRCIRVAAARCRDAARAAGTDGYARVEQCGERCLRFLGREAPRARSAGVDDPSVGSDEEQAASARLRTPCSRGLIHLVEHERQA